MDIRLQENLKNVQHNYIAPFLWLHGEDDSLIVSEIERIYDSGIRSVCVESRTHEDFVADGWWSDMELILEECKKRDMNVWILDDKHFPSGYANGIFIEKYKELQPWGVTEVHIDVPGPVTEGAVMADCWLSNPDDEFIGVVALKHNPNCESYSEAVDITDGLSNGMVYFSLPEGMWRIVFIIKTRKGITEKARAFSDKLNKKATELYIEEVYQPHFDRLKQYFGNTLLGFFSDEPSFKNNSANRGLNAKTGVPFDHHPWSDGVKDTFSAFFGEKQNCFLAGLWFDIKDISFKARHTYMDYITDQYKNNFCNTLADWCHAHGVMYIGHIIEDNNVHALTSNGPGHYFRAVDGQDMSGIDVVLHQIVPGLAECSNAGYVSYKHMNNDFFHYYLGKLGSSMAHIDKKKKGRAMCEIFGAYGWAEGSKIMKYLMDHMLVRGINYFVPHAFSPKPDDPDCPPNFYDSGKNPQYKYFKAHMDYLNRMSHLLSDGIHHSTCAILYDAESRWANGEFLPLEKVGKKLYDNLLDYDVIPSDYLELIDENGCLNGEKYNIILVPFAEGIDDETITKLKNLSIEVITVGTKAIHPDLPEFVLLEDLADYMKKRGFADITSDYEGIYLRALHYQRGGAHIYMFSNEDRNNEICTTLHLSAFSGGKYIEYDAVENKALCKTSKNGDAYIDLPPYNSVVIITGDVSFDDIPVFSEEHITSVNEIEAEYSISIAKSNCDSFEPYKKTSELFNMTSPDNIPDFSGHIRYDAEIDINAQGKTILDLGYVGEIAELYVNGKHSGARMFPPYSFDITDKIVKGKNKISVIVSNHSGYAKRDKFSKYLLFEPTGMLGPVTLKCKK